MMQCPHLIDNQCRVATQMADCSVKPSAAACLDCQGCENPRAVNLVTIGMAIVHRKRRNRDTAALRNLLKNYLPGVKPPETHTLKITDFRPGPGTELKRMLAWFAQPNDSCQCETRAETMNDWSADGCRDNLDTIVGWLMEEAELRGLPHGSITRTAAKTLVSTAIRKFERKYPEGAEA
ncbi:hypothetical protein [Novipirellula artificiosorum]|uniref:Uncharacterized protein n=1 Tax=Novipirellula artificiosorum TaxID=2528016 RepID=A0A5C6DSQ2_9BACT|nr:hypothetical protein [Novipirellula artificiosorum]TWU39315.1 hypothetical protein Poly41_21390 [Novipirellula artificiosorum]